MTGTAEQLLYTVEETAALCRVGRTAIYAAIRDGRLQAVKIGASRRVPREAVDRFLATLPDAVAASA
ncbi:MAG: helix-turn-helix domain-containing protein [Dehalococcoidia bacterium]